MKKAHRLMIPLLVVISISALLGASLVSAKVDWGECWCLCEEDGERCHWDPICCRDCGGLCTGYMKGTTRGKRPAQSYPPHW